VGSMEPVMAFRRALQEQPLLADALRAASNASPASVALTCVSQAKNDSMFTDQCMSVFSQLQAISPTGGVTMATVDAICKAQCFQRFVNFVKMWGKCLKQNMPSGSPSSGGTSSGGSSASSSSGTGFGIDSGEMTPALELIKHVADLFCLKNENGNYCIVQMQSMGQSMANVADPSAMCSILTSAGCCFSTFFQFAQKMNPGTMDPTIMPQIEKIAKDNCNGLVLAPPCNPTAGAAKLQGVAKLSLLWDWWNAQSPTKQALIKTAVCTDLAAAAGFYVDQCSVTNVVQATGGRRLLAASTAFDYQVTGVSVASLETSKTALSGNVNYNDVSAASQTTVTGTSSVNSIQASNAVAMTGNAVVALFLAVIAVLAL